MQQTNTLHLSGSDSNSMHIGIEFYLPYLQYKVNKTKRLLYSFTRSCLDSPRVYSTGYSGLPRQAAAHNCLTRAQQDLTILIWTDIVE